MEVNLQVTGQTVLALLPQERVDPDILVEAFFRTRFGSDIAGANRHHYGTRRF
jgi:hypothetical protein